MQQHNKNKKKWKKPHNKGFEQKDVAKPSQPIRIERIDDKTVAFTINKTDSKGKITPHIGLLTNDYEQYSKFDKALDAAGQLTFKDVLMIQSDCIVKSYMNKLLGKSNGIKRTFDWGNVKDEVREFIKALWISLKWNDFNRYVFSSKYYSNSVIQIIWENVDTELIGDTLFPAGQKIVEFRQENPENFGYNTDLEKGDIGDLMYLPDDANYTRLYPYNFIVIRNNPDFNHVEGLSDLAELKPLIMLKNLLLKTKARYFRKSVIPSFIGLYKSEKTGDALIEEAQIIANNLSQIENGAGVALPNVDSIVTLEPNRQVNFEQAEELINKQIAVRILGTDLLSSTSKSTYASAKVGTEQFQDAVKELALILQDWNNYIIKLSVRNRFGESEVVPTAVFDMTDKFDIEVFRFMMESGIPVSWEELNKTFPLPRGLPIPEDDTYNWDNAAINRVVAKQNDIAKEKANPLDEDGKEKDKKRKEDKQKEETSDAAKGK